MSDNDSVLRVAVAGAAGPSGKSTVIANLAVALASAGKRVVIVDADPNVPLQHRLFGRRTPPKSLEEFFQGKAEQLYDTVIQTGLARVHLVAGWSRSDSRPLRPAHRNRLLRHLDRLGAQIVLIDCGARPNGECIDYFNRADYRLVVTTDQPKAAQSAYSFIKNATVQLLDQAATTSDDIALINRYLPAGGTVRIADAISALQTKNAELSASLQQLIANYQLGIVINRVSDDSQSGIGFALSRLVNSYLQITPRVVGEVHEHPAIEQGGRRGQPFLADSIYSTHGRGFLSIAEVLLSLDANSIRRSREREGSLGETLRPKREIQDDSMAQVHEMMRRHERIPVDWDARLHVENNAAPPGEGPLIDFSIGGAAIATQLDVDPGTEVTLWLTDREELPGLRAIVRHISRRGPPRVGLEFIGKDTMSAALELAVEAKKAHLESLESSDEEEEPATGEDSADESPSPENATSNASPPEASPEMDLPSLFSDTPLAAADAFDGPTEATTAPPPAIFPYQKPQPQARPAQPPPDPAGGTALDEFDLSSFDDLD